MTKNHLFLILSLIFFKAVITEDFDCASGFERIKAQYCFALSTEDQYCSYVDNECKEWYKKCEDYKPTTDFDEAICKKIVPFSFLKKCDVEEEGGKKKCVTVNQNCEDISDITCTAATTADGKRCIFKGEGQKCEVHSNSCSGLTQAECNDNIPLDAKMTCSWDGTTCKEVSRKCNEYKLFQDSKTSTYEQLCAGLETGASKTCILIDNQCKEVYQSCESITDKNECEKAKPLNDDKLTYNPLKKCKLSGDNCVTKPRICSDWKKGEETEETCGQLISETTGKICSFNSEKQTCEEIYKDCNSYNSVADSDKNADECEAILTGKANYKCKFVSGSCEEIEIKCEDFSTEESCFAYQPRFEKYKCIFKEGRCIEELKTCENFRSLVMDKTKEKCESITTFGGEHGNFFGKCVYAPTTWYGCNFDKYLTCEEYKGESEYICSLYYGGPYGKCVMKDKKCTSELELKSCYDYNNAVAYENKTKEGCESIKLANSYEKCYFNENNKYCNSQTLPCSDYTGNDPAICRLYAASKSKSCGIVNGKCVEINNYIYKYCYNYSGKGLDKKICEEIQPKYGNEYDFSKKCVLVDEYRCEEETKDCSEAKSEIECLAIIPEDTKKRCIFKGNSCVEQYNSCEDYQNSGAEIDKNTCESIIMENKPYSKCKFTEGSKTCTEVTRKCSEFKFDTIANLCYNNTLSLDTKRCSYSNNACSLIDIPNCLELYHSKDATEEICNKAKTSSDNKICSLKIDGSGCDEFNNPNPKSTSDSTSNSENASEDDGKYLDAFGIALVVLQCLLL